MKRAYKQPLPCHATGGDIGVYEDVDCTGLNVISEMENLVRVYSHIQCNVHGQIRG